MRTMMYKISTHIKEHQRYYIVTIFLLVVGISCGSTTALRLPAEISLRWGSTLGSTLSSDQTIIFWRVLFRELRFFALIAICGIGMVGIPAIGILVGVRGFIMGFVTGFLLGNYGMGGFLLSMMAVIPQNVILLPALLAASTTAMRAPLQKRWGREYWFTMLCCFGVALIGAVVETLLSGLLPKSV